MMELILCDIQVINRDKKLTQSKEIPAEFEDYLQQIFNTITGNKVVKEYEPRSEDSFVLKNIRQILFSQVVEEKNKKYFTDIAQRLLIKEIEAQQQVNKLNIEVQVGSLIQAIFYDDKLEKYLYLLAKVEHTSFVNDEDYSFQTGFQKELKKVYKSCIYLIDGSTYDVEGVKIYLDNVAKYWFDDFLELQEKTSDEINTGRAFKSIDSYLNRTMKKKHPEDRSIIRNAFISYFRTNKLINFEEMISTIFDDYKSVSLENDEQERIRKHLLTLPSQKGFDSLFTVSLSALKARIRATYDLYPGIKLRVEDNIEKIKSFENEEGIHYIMVETTNNDVYNSFDKYKGRIDESRIT